MSVFGVPARMTVLVIDRQVWLSFAPLTQICRRERDCPFWTFLLLALMFTPGEAGSDDVC